MYESAEATSWVESMIDGDWLSSTDESSGSGELSLRAVSFPFELDDDSVDDEEYYQGYARYNHTPTKLSEQEVLAFLHMARQKANEHKDSMSRETLHDILNIYGLILASCDMHYKRQLIKEYEAIKASYPTDPLEMEQAYREYNKARDNHLGFDQQKFHYRNAIAYMPSMERKVAWKKEYNSFLTLWINK